MEEKKEETSLRDAFYRWIGLFLVVVAAIAIYFIIANIDVIFNVIGKYTGILRPILFGGVIAYLLTPLVKLFERNLLKLAKRGKKPVSDKVRRMISGFSIFFALICGVIIVVVLCLMIIPQLLQSILSLINNLPSRVNYYYNLLSERIKNSTFLDDDMQLAALGLTGSLEDLLTDRLLPWLQSNLLPSVNTIAQKFAVGVAGFFNVLYNLFVGIIVAVYLLIGKKTFLAQAKKIAYGLLKKEHADVVIHYLRLTNKMFTGFIVGKIVDSTIIGFLCFFLMRLMQLPYAMLISVIVGVTNIIPVFGPYIGMVPSALLILLINPMQAVYFLIMIILLQQLDGNVIGPAILGESTGLSAFWVLVAILLFGGLWGILGMIVGVPLFAILYRIFADFINWRLHGRGLSAQTDSYRDLEQIQIEQNQVSYVKFAKEERRAAADQKKLFQNDWIKKFVRRKKEASAKKEDEKHD